MTITAIPRAVGRGYLAFAKALASNREKPNWGDHIAAGFVCLLLIWFFSMMAFVALEWFQTNHLSAAGHLAKAKEVCGTTPHCADAQIAIENLRAIPSTAAVFPEASKLLAQLNTQVAEDKENGVSVARQQMIRNFKGEANDPFRCGQSAKDNQDILSFDDGKTWWKDDGRCAVRLQKKRDEDAELSSYWSATVRVDTDMNSSWLPDEERVCQTYPNSNGKVSTVRCSATDEGATHNIPVEFWGGVNRNTVSGWKCRREKSLLDDRFVCRAID
jgi:hypothetical protein